MRTKIQPFCIAALLGLTAIGCENPELATDLDTEGPPEVTSILVLSEGRTVDSTRDGVDPFDSPTVATFCAQQPGMKVHRGYCPRNDAGEVLAAIPVMDAQPAAWFAWISFSELLDPNVEELIDTNGDGAVDQGTLANTQPVTVTCGGTAIAYSGHYQPSGNDVSGLPGPALRIEPLEQVATGAECQLTIKSTVTDKEGNSINPDFAGPFIFGLADMSVAGTIPADGATGVDISKELTVEFNAAVAADSLGAGTISLVELDAEGAEIATVDAMFTADAVNAVVTPVAALNPESSYKLTVSETGVRDAGGGELTLAAPSVITFKTGKAKTE